MRKKEEMKFKHIQVGGVEFAVDVAANRLVELQNPLNNIPFDQMQYHGTHYTMSFDHRLKNIPTAHSRNWDVSELKVPQLIELDPEGMALKYGKPVHWPGGNSDFRMMVDEKLLLSRLRGNKPMIEIIGTSFIVDLEQQALVSSRAVQTQRVNFQELILSPDKKNYRAVYDLVEHKNTFLPVSDLLSTPKGLVLIEFPIQQYLDPVGFLRSQMGKSPDSFVGGNDYAAQHFLMSHQATRALAPAKVITWEEVGVGKRIEHNLERFMNKQFDRLARDKLPAIRRRNKRMGL